jgi:hypothetical protein
MSFVRFASVTLFAMLAGIGYIRPATAQVLQVPCKATESAVFSNRIHVQCLDPVDGRFQFFAAPTTDSHQAARILSIIESAHFSNRFLAVTSDFADVSGSAIGCDPSNCRLITSISMVDTPPQTITSCQFDNSRTGCPGFCATHTDDPVNCHAAFCKVPAHASDFAHCPVQYCNSAAGKNDFDNCPTQFCQGRSGDSRCNKTCKNAPNSTKPCNDN